MRGVILALLVGAAVARAGVAPAANLIDFENTGGAAFSIPTFSHIINVKNAPYFAIGDGVADDTAKIQQAITDSVTAGDVIYLPAGIYRTTATLTVNNKSLVIRGAGRTGHTWSSALKTDTTNYAIGVEFKRTGGSFSLINISSGYTKGSTSLVFADAAAISTIAVGDWITVTETNVLGAGGGPLVYNDGGGTGRTYLGLTNGGTRCQTQIVKVTAKNSATLTINRPLYWTLTAANTPQILEFNSTTAGPCGIEDIRIERVQLPPDPQNPRGNSLIKFTAVNNGWVRNVEGYHSAGGFVLMEFAWGCVVRDSYFHLPLSNASGMGYGAWFFGPNSDHLIEGNIFELNRHSIIPEGGASGCVFAYNYCLDAYGSDGAGIVWMNGSMDTHGCHPFCNLWEGDIDTKYSNDHTHGSSANNTVYRSWIRGQGTNLTFTNGLAAIAIEARSYYNAIVGCIIGTSGQAGTRFAVNGSQQNEGHWTSYRLGFDGPGSADLTDSNVAATTVLNRTYDFAGGGEYAMNTGGLDATLPSSLYYTAGRPPWATGFFPIFDPSYPASASIPLTPAGYRYNNNGAAYPDFTPTNPFAVAISSSAITFTWDDHATGETGYVIERSTNGVTYSVIGTVAPNATSYADSGLQPSTQYYYRTSAYLGPTTTTTPSTSAVNATTPPAPDPNAGAVVGTGLLATPP